MLVSHFFSPRAHQANVVVILYVLLFSSHKMGYFGDDIHLVSKCPALQFSVSCTVISLFNLGF